ncbi:MAG: ATPase [Parcubacteria group bacterium GW2011_GWC1_45_13]|uniref:ATPase n=1 Tax=Candidatus Giovannonibacteria bacterium GW2011_GWA1_44_29 TaxID=1618646 RepID=A0A0G1IXD6_9BACT|nr:MAG: ATPase [Candidatus Giovannonibacteria bacterium GW2011_GWA1_44_29]KKT91909.1 MAG: ATPase [Parcubacteria group bacterium GW2011_GWC1_45_13]
MNQWHTKEVTEILDAFQSREHGLTKEEAAERLKEHGFNKLPEGKVDGFPIIFLRQFQSPLIYILLAASMVVFAMGETIDGSIILAVLFFNAVVGAIQEGKAQNTLRALKKFVETRATVLRERKELIISDSEVVPGDIIILQEGEKVPADARIITATNLKIDEAALTGESEPVHKIADTLERDSLPTAEQKNMIFKGTHILAGNGRAIVVATGALTVIGKISKEIAAVDTEIPLKANIRYLSRLIIITVASISALLFIIGIVSGKSAKEMFTTVVSLSVSIIPEGLPIVMTLVLATGVWRMSKRNALVKKLQAVEALGQARVIAVDKTGTITKNEMVIQKVYLAGGKAGAGGKFFEIGGIGYEPKGEIRLNGSAIDSVNHPELLLAGKIAAFCANARVLFSEEEKIWRIAGDPTEAAMLVFAEKLGFHKDDLERESPLVSEIPFDYKLKYHATIHKIENQKLLTVVGAPEKILELSQISKEEKQELESVFLSMSREGLRIVALAETRNGPEMLTSEKIKSLTFVGFFGMKDALREEVAEAMQKAASAGIRVVMITGDHKVTARAIAKEAGLYQDGDTILTGQDIDVFSDNELSEKLAKTSVVARVTPEHKLRIIKAYKARGEIVAMTGDGVNDAPSLVAADLGVAMGRIGTEVAKEASDIVLLDDNFGSIVSAVEEGRSIYKTIKKVILYLFSTSLGEALTITGALLLGYPLPLLPAQIIWLNFVTDGFLDVALAMEPKEEGLLRGNFERPKKYLVDKLMVQRMFVMAIPMMIGTLFLFKGYFENDLAKAWTISLTTLAVFQWFNAWNCRHESKSIFQTNPFSNKFLVAATITIIFLQLLAVYNPVMQKLLKITPITVSDWLLIVPMAASIVLVEEIRKFFYRRRLLAKR